MTVRRRSCQRTALTTRVGDQVTLFVKPGRCEGGVDAGVVADIENDPAMTHDEL